MSDTEDTHHVFIVVRNEEGQEIVSRKIGIIDQNRGYSFEPQYDMDFHVAYELLQDIAGTDWKRRREAH